jgi:hypothetical protein
MLGQALGERRFDKSVQPIHDAAAEHPGCSRLFSSIFSGNADMEMGRQEIGWRTPKMRSVAEFRCDDKPQREALTVTRGDQDVTAAGVHLRSVPCAATSFGS